MSTGYTMDFGVGTVLYRVPDGPILDARKRECMCVTGVDGWVMAVDGNESYYGDSDNFKETWEEALVEGIRRAFLLGSESEECVLKIQADIIAGLIVRIEKLEEEKVR